MRKILYIFVIALLVLTACEKSELSSIDYNQKADVATINNNIDILSSLIAKSSGDNVDLRKTIKNEVGKKFDYDYDALLITFVGKEISGVKFEKILASHSEGKYTSVQIVNMIKSSGYLQISIPVLFDEFDPVSISPITIGIPVEIKSETPDQFIGYNSDGSSLTISAKTAPDQVVFVIMQSERIDKNGNLKVNENGLYIEKKERVHYSKIIAHNSNRQLVKSDINKLIEVLSNEEYNSLLERNKKEDALRKINSVHNASNLINVDVLGNLLRATAKSANTVELQWQPVEGANRFVIRRSGYNKINGIKVYKPDVIIGDVTETYTKSDLVDFSNEEYSYNISYYNENIFIGQSYLVTIHSSHRKSGGTEYVKKIIASKRMVEILEGWWASDLEIRAQITYMNSNADLSDAGDVGFVIPTIGSGIFAKLRPVDWTGNMSLFTWDRSVYDCGSYTIILEETDNIDDVLDKMEIAVGWVKFLQTEFQPIIKEVFTTTQKSIEVYDKPDYIAAFHVKWWDPQDFLRNVNSTGFSIVINHDTSK